MKKPTSTGKSKRVKRKRVKSAACDGIFSVLEVIANLLATLTENGKITLHISKG
jgi:hypothetical protein